ncbi:uroporphyrinogen-III synthase [Nesterenkonia pannonica]|uniref:uroporphyrinogen-III synthase n=1 Tax=Nesterenkonia pannonica TaxID=1548602 RepID=UPI002164A1F7|nr:uroporphyrinogen-III synthase [Nesterenkonia pannonica]
MRWVPALPRRWPGSRRSTAHGCPRSTAHKESSTSSGRLGAANRIFLPQSAQARPLLADGLLSMGWQVVSAPAYETVPVQGPLPWRPEAEDVVLVTASSAAHEWVRRGLSARAVLAIGEPTARSLRELGAPADAVLAEPTAAGVLAAVESLG